MGLGKGSCKGSGMDRHDKMWAIILSFFLFNGMTLRCMSKKRKRGPLGSFFNFGRTSFHGEGIPNYYSHSLIV